MQKKVWKILGLLILTKFPGSNDMYIATCMSESLQNWNLCLYFSCFVLFLITKIKTEIGGLFFFFFFASPHSSIAVKTKKSGTSNLAFHPFI